MLKELLDQLFKKLKEDPNNDHKSTSGSANYFVERILEEKFEKYNLITSKSLVSYYEKHVEGKENNSGKPSSELKNIIAEYLGYENYTDFVSNCNFGKQTGDTDDPPSSKWWKWLILIGVIIGFLGLYYNGVFTKYRCLEWKEDHYEEINCNGKQPNPLLKNIDIDQFRKLPEKGIDTTTFFIKGNPVVWYGKNENGELEFFSSQGVHPITHQYLKPVTRYIIDKHIMYKDSLNPQ